MIGFMIMGYLAGTGLFGDFRDKLNSWEDELYKALERQEGESEVIHLVRVRERVSEIFTYLRGDASTLEQNVMMTSAGKPHSSLV